MQIKPTFFGLFPLFRPPLLARQGANFSGTEAEAGMASSAASGEAAAAQEAKKVSIGYDSL